VITDSTNSAAKEQTTQAASQRTFAKWSLAVVSFGFIILQSACTWVMAVSGARLLIGLSALAAASGLNRPSSGFHADVIRVPMMIVAVAGSLINLYVIWRIRSLRARPSSQWRMAATPKGKIRAENFQIALAILTLILVIAEEATHLIVHNA
jgi:hypothetical protein